MTRRALFLFPSDRMGGAEQVTRTLAREAARSGAFDEVHCFVLCWSRTGTLDGLLETGRAHLHYTEARREAGGLPGLIAMLMRGGYDFVFSSHTHLNALASLMRRLRLLRTKRLVARESTVIFDRDFGWKGAIIRAFYGLYGGQDQIVCQTTLMRDSFNAHTGGRFADRTVVRRNPVDRERIEAGLRQPLPPEVAAIPANRRKIVWCGRFIPVKDPLLAIDVLAELHAGGADDRHLVMIGDGPLLDAAKFRAAERNVASHVTFTGFLPNPAAVMGACETGLLTSVREGFPNVVLEMVACGIKAVCVSRCCGDLEQIAGIHISENRAATDFATIIGQIDIMSTSDKIAIVDVLDIADIAVIK